MSDAVSVRITGMAETIRNLQTLPLRVERKIVSQAMRAALNPLQATAKALIAVGPGHTGGKYPHPPGTLKKRVLLRGGKKFNKTEIRLRVYLGTLGISFYGQWYEYGHAVGKRPAGMGHKRGDVLKARLAGSDTRAIVPGKHVMKQAYEQHKTQIVQDVSNRLTAGVEAEVEAGAKS